MFKIFSFILIFLIYSCSLQVKGISPEPKESPEFSETGTGKQLNETEQISQNATISASKVEKLIWEKTNQERDKAGLNPLGYESKIADVARKHSQNMAVNGFFDHTDLDGNSSSDRIAIGNPDLYFSNSGENIAINYGNSEEEAATNLVKAWMDSPPHRENILNKGFTYIGVGIYFKGNKIYGTQNFAKPIARLKKGLPAYVNQGESINPEFRYYPGGMDKSQLVVFVEFPNSQVSYNINGSIFIGAGKYYVNWTTSESFTLEIPCDKGKGVYQINLCQNNSCYDTDFKVSVR
jgi:uncharacterized protein YkwD